MLISDNLKPYIPVSYHISELKSLTRHRFRLVKENDFTGKTIISFCTSSSSGLGQSGKLLEQEANTGKWIEGHRFNSNLLDSDIKTWTDSLK